MSGSRITFIDTNIFIRFFVKDEKRVFDECFKFIEKIKQGKIKAAISTVILLEIHFVLSSFYNFPKDRICQALASILNLPNLKFIDNFNQQKALEFYQSKNIKFTDCLIASILFDKPNYSIVSYDKDFDKLGIKRFEPQEI